MDTTKKEVRLPTVHSMKRRSTMHDYSYKGCYHVTISAARGVFQPFGKIAGRTDRPDGDAEAPHVVLSAVGEMVRRELLESI